MSRFLLSLLALYICACYLLFPGPKLDSLEMTLSKIERDSSKLKILSDLAWYYKDVRPSKALGFAFLGLEIADKYSLTKYLAEFNGILGANYLVLSDINKAISHYDSALNYAYRLNDTLMIASFMNNLGVSYKMIRQFDKALELYKNSMNLYLKSKKPKKVAYSYTNLALIYDAMNKLNEATEYNNKALQIYIQSKDTAGMINSFNNLAVVLRKRNFYDQAITYLNKSIMMARHTGDSNSVATALMNTGYIYAIKRDFQQSIKYYDEAKQISDKIEDVEMNIELLNNYGTSFLGLKKYNEALKYVMQSLELSKKYDKLDRIYDSYILLNKIYFNLKNFENANNYLVLALTIKDSMYNNKFNETLAMETSKADAEIMGKYDLEQKNYRISLLEQNREITRVYIRWLWVVIILVISLSVLSYLMYRTIRKRNNELSKAITELKIKDEELNNSLMIKDKLFHIISHDLKSPMGIFLNISDYLAENYKEMTEDDIQQFLFDLKRSSTHLNYFLDNLILWSKIQTGKIICNQDNFDLSMLCRHVGRDMIDAAKNKHIVMADSYQDSLFAYADINLVAIVVKHFISNAVKYSHIDNKIELKTYSFDTFAIFEIRDFGVGIEQERFDKLLSYDKLQKTKGTKEEPGTGLGLIICKQLLEMNNGRLEFDSEIGNSTIFRAYLPLSNHN